MGSNFFNRGTVRGVISKSEIVTYQSNGTSGHFYAADISTGGGNKTRIVLWPTKANPNRAYEYSEQYRQGMKVEVTGKVSERDVKSKKGPGRKEQSVTAFGIEPVMGDITPVSNFVLQGVVERVRETDDAAIITLRLDEKYTPKNADKPTVKSTNLDLTCVGDSLKLLDILGISKGCNVRFKGQILNKLEVDEYGDVLGSCEMLKVDKISDVIPPDDYPDFD